MKTIKVGLLGAGVVGGGVINLLTERKAAIEARVGAPVELAMIGAKEIGKHIRVPLDTITVTKDAFEVATNPDIDIVIELMGGIHPALEVITQALKNGKSVVTANKHLLAKHGEEIYAAAEQAKTEIGFEAAVAGAVPIIRSLKEAFAVNRILSIFGIVNGTGNYILSKMSDEGLPFAAALKDAQNLGYAEADPTFDVEGIDSAHKIAILAALAFHTPVDFGSIYTEGITFITPDDIAMAKEFGYRIKLLAVAKRVDDKIDVRVHPAMIPLSHPMAGVNGALNAVEVIGHAAGVNMLVGPGAGSDPTASAVLGDVMDIARNIANGVTGIMPPLIVPAASRRKKELRPMTEVTTRYYLRFTVPDKPGVLAMLAGAIGEHGISIASMIQRGREPEKPVSVVMLTHTAKEGDVKAALGKIESLGLITSPTALIRIEGEEEK